MMPDRPADTGFPQPPPIPDLPAQTQADPIPHVLSTPASDQGGPTIFHQDRNKGLAGSARTNSRRARAAARLADPEVTDTLHAPDWQAHPLINLATARAFPKLLAAAARAGWRTDDRTNTAALPASPEARKILENAGVEPRPVHDSGHAKWNSEAFGEVRKIPAELEEEDIKEGTSAYDQAVKEKLQKIQETLRQKMLKLDRLSQNDQTPSTAST